MSIFLDQQELSDLTGYYKKSKQAEWLSRRGWNFELSRLGKVKVLRRYAEMKLGMPADTTINKSTEPDFSSLT
ncbi:MAG: DUF4224 domain-containing protein [Nitrosomonas sp.]|nr:DUF4224 domain-containing protein [Nitrosomonas sp.]